MAIGTGLKVLYIGVMIFTGAMLTAVLVVIWNMPDLPDGIINDELCLPQSPWQPDSVCDKVEIRMADYMDKELHRLNRRFKKTENRIGQEEKELPIELQAFLDTYPDRRPLASFTGKDPDNTKDDSPDMTPIRNWQSGRRTTDYGGYERYDVSFKDGRIVVPLTGLYFVYSVTDMYESCDSTSGMPKGPYDTIRHSIYRFNVKTGVEKEIVASSIPHQKSKRFRDYYYSSYYLSTALSMTAGDVLAVKIKNSACQIIAKKRITLVLM